MDASDDKSAGRTRPDAAIVPTILIAQSVLDRNSRKRRRELGDWRRNAGCNVLGENEYPSDPAAMEKTADAYELSSLGNALGGLAENLPAKQAVAAAQYLVAAMEKTVNLYILSDLGSALGGLGENLPIEQAVVGAQYLVAAMEKTADSTGLSSLGEALAALVVSMEITDTSSVLKSLVCVGDTRIKVLEGLEKKTGQTFDGNLWKAVAWLEKQGVDLKSVPRFPILREQ